MRIERLRDRFFEGIPRYRWLDSIGRGGMGVVFKAQDLELDEVVAIKVLSPDLEGDEHELLTRFKREINLNRRIKHPNVARIHDFGTSGDYPYITMEYVPGRDLRTLIRQEGRLAPLRAISIIRQIALGTNAAHKLGIVHRDLKSQNIVVDDSGAVAILDFGLARGRLTDGLTLDSVMIGTPHYMSPEQALGKPTDARSDIYSIGVMAFEALTGDVPFKGDSPLVIAMNHVSQPVPESLLKLSDVPPELAAIVLRALAKNADERFASAADLEAELAMLRLPATGAGAAPPPPSTPSPFPEVGDTSGAEAGFSTLQLDVPPEVEPPRIPVPPPPPPEAVAVAADDAAHHTIPASSGMRVTVKDRPPSVLLVEGDAVQRRLLEGYITQFGCRILEARSGQEALETLLRETVDLVLMDVKLPDMDGFDVTRIIKSQRGTGAIPVVLMSARLDRNHFAFGIQTGAADFLSMPVVLDSMIARLWNILQHRGFIPPSGNETLNAALRDALISDTPHSGVRYGADPR